MDETQTHILKHCHTIFPMGFGVQKIDNSVIVVNFVDTTEDEQQEQVDIIASIAMTEERAKKLIEALGDAVQETDHE